MIALVGGVMGGLDAYRRGVLVPVILNCLDLIKHWATFGHRGRRVALASPGAITIPYGVAIAIGAVMWWFWGAWTAEARSSRLAVHRGRFILHAM